MPSRHRYDMPTFYSLVYFNFLSTFFLSFLSSNLKAQCEPDGPVLRDLFPQPDPYRYDMLTFHLSGLFNFLSTIFLSFFFLISRPNVNLKAQHYGICFLSQILIVMICLHFILLVYLIFSTFFLSFFF